MLYFLWSQYKIGRFFLHHPIIIGLDIGWLPVRRQGITWTNADLLSIGLFGNNQPFLSTSDFPVLLILWVSLECLTHWGLVTPFGDRSGSILAQVMACCLTAPSLYLNQCWLVSSKIQLHSSDGNFTRDALVINDYNKHENHSSKMSLKSPRGQWVKKF